MDEKDFDKAAELARVGQDSRIHSAAKMVMVDGMSQRQAARECGIIQPAVSVAIKRIQKITAQALDLAEYINSKGDK